MNWFQRHLNWTLVIAFLLSLACAAAAGFWYGFFNYYQDINDITSVAGMIGYIIFLAINIPVTCWVLRQKGRSMAWSILLLLNLIGFIVALCLSNKRMAMTPETETWLK